jgi:5-methylcytosine-specific restriction endonuclease McrA
MSLKEQRSRYRKKYPEKVKEHRKKYLFKKLLKKIEQNPDILKQKEERLIQDFCRLTRLTFENILPKQCENCGSTEDLQIHHKQYKFPIIKEDLIRLCRKCHIEEHQKIPLPLE